MCVSTACFEPSIDYFHHDVELLYGRVQTVGECQARCQARDDCHYFTFNTRTKACFLKDKDAVQARGPGLVDFVSGPKFCGECDASCRRCRAHGSRRCRVRLENAGAACTLGCCSTPRTTLTTVAPAFMYSAAVRNRCFGASSSDSDCMLPGVQYNGHDIKGISAGELRSIGECQERCRATKECYFFSFNKATKSCFLKSGNAPKEQKSGVADFISGTKTCSKSRMSSTARRCAASSGWFALIYGD